MTARSDMTTLRAAAARKPIYIAAMSPAIAFALAACLRLSRAAQRHLNAELHVTPCATSSCHYLKRCRVIWQRAPCRRYRQTPSDRTLLPRLKKRAMPGAR